jgi:hypothetical protein
MAVSSLSPTVFVVFRADSAPDLRQICAGFCAEPVGIADQMDRLRQDKGSLGVQHAQATKTHFHKQINPTARRLIFLKSFY